MNCRKALLVIYSTLLLAGYAWSQDNYSNLQQLETSIQTLQRQYPQWVEAQSLVETVGGQNIWLLTIGDENRADHPGILIAGGVDGSHLLGQALAMGVARRLLEGSQTDSIRQLLSGTTFYILPQLSPDAAAQYFDQLRYERRGNASSTDSDRDGLFDEDPGEDLNKDGLLTMMRIEDPAGDWLPHAADERILVRAQTEKGQTGRYKLLPEGINSDKDDRWNEDGPGGVFFNKNLTFDYQPFSEGSGEFPVSEKETKAVLDFLFDQWNIFAVLTFGPSDNLRAPLSYNPKNEQDRKILGILKNDAVINKLVASWYQKQVKLPKTQQPTTSEGGFMEWAYFHYGRFSFGTPGWYPPKWEMPKDSATMTQFKPNTDNNEEVDFLRWAEQEGLNNAFVPWTKIDHPDFPGKTVEVGGFAPFVRTNPPYAKVDGIIDNHFQFIQQLARYQPKVEWLDVEKEKVDGNLWRVKATLKNQGLLPTHSEVGQRFKWVKHIRVALDLQNNQQLLNGQKIQLLDGLEGGATKTYSWLIKGNGKLGIEAAAPHCGKRVITVDLN